MSMKNKGLLVCGALLVASSALAQDVYVTLVEARFTVTDRAGQFVGNLTRDDVTVYDNDVPQTVTDLTVKAHLPIRVALVIDRSLSVDDRFPFVKRAAAEFARAVIREPEDQGMVVAFDTRAFLLQDWTSDGEALVGAIDGLTAAGGTSVFDALLKTCRDGFGGTDPRQRVVVLVTDGEDTTSRASVEQAVDMARSARVMVYVVGIRAEASLNTRELQGRHVLTELADVTGGRVLYPADGQGHQLGPVFSMLAEEMRNQYRVAYYLDVPPDNAFHRLRVETRNRALHIHAPSGFYARPALWVR